MLMKHSGGYVISAVFICAEYQRLGVMYRDMRILRISFWMKLIFIIIEVALAIGMYLLFIDDSNANLVSIWNAQQNKALQWSSLCGMGNCICLHILGPQFRGGLFASKKYKGPDGRTGSGRNRCLIHSCHHRSSVAG
jgi:hypothetical protein